MVRPLRNKLIPNMQEAIKVTAWKQIAEFGATALSLRAIARELGITAPAIYNYFPNRDALVTALIVDAFSSFANLLQESISVIPEHKPAERLRVLGLNYRAWAVTYPERYQLIFGTPIAGYVAPIEITQPVAGRSLAILVDVLQSALSAKKLNMEPANTLSPQLRAMLTAWQQAGGQADEQALFLALAIWGQVHGLVSVEIGHQYPPFITDPGEIYHSVLEGLIDRCIPKKKNVNKPARKHLDNPKEYRK